MKLGTSYESSAIQPVESQLALQHQHNKLVDMTYVTSETSESAANPLKIALHNHKEKAPLVAEKASDEESKQ